MNLIKVPFASLNLGKNKGAVKAPEEIVKNLEKFYLTEEGNLVNFEIKEVVIDENNVEKSVRTISEMSKKCFERSEKNIFIGGDHSITYPIFKSFAQFEDNPGIVIFDAHPDCQSDFNPPTHEDLLLALVKEGVVKRENIVLVGIRNWSKEEKEFLEKEKIRFFSMKDISMEGIYEISEGVMSIANRFSGLYVSIDIDVLDPSFAPGTGYPEPGGLSTRELLFFLQRLKKLRNFKGGDLVEIDGNCEKTTLLGAKLLTEIG